MSAELDRETELEKVYGWLALLSLVVGLISSFVVVGWQGLVWLQTGHFPTISLFTVFSPDAVSSPFWDWLARPDGWYGLHRIVNFLVKDTPLFVWLSLSGPILNYVFEREANNVKAYRLK